MELENLGYSTELQTYRTEKGLETFGVGRVISEHRERYLVRTDSNEFEGEVIGNLRFTIKERSDFPAVGDWVAISEYDDNKVLIHAVYPRKTVLERSSVGKTGEKQIIATNIDYAMLIQALDRDFNLNRIERYLTICLNSGVQPILLLNKTDLISEAVLERILLSVKERSGNYPLIPISNRTRQGYDELMRHIHSRKTYCLLGSSGVGKSSLINNLTGHISMKTNSISSSTNKGRHVTSHRELFIIQNGAIMIDNPGMREVGIADSADGIEKVFPEISRISSNCRFVDCTHIHEAGCAIIEALDTGEIVRSQYDNYLKMIKEKTHFESSLEEKRRKEKNLSRAIRDFKNFKKRNE